VCTLSRVGDVEHHQRAMTAPDLSLSAEPSAHYLRGTEIERQGSDPLQPFAWVDGDDRRCPLGDPCWQARSRPSWARLPARAANRRDGGSLGPREIAPHWSRTKRFRGSPFGARLPDAPRSRDILPVNTRSRGGFTTRSILVAARVCSFSGNTPTVMLSWWSFRSPTGRSPAYRRG